MTRGQPTPAHAAACSPRRAKSRIATHRHTPKRAIANDGTGLLPVFACATAHGWGGRGVLDLGSELVARRGGCWNMGRG